MKTLIKTLKFQISGLANPSPPIGPALGALGVRIMDFCNQYNKSLGIYPLRFGPQNVRVSIYSDKSFSWVVMQPSTANLIKSEIGLSTSTQIGSGSRRAGTVTVGRITKAQVRNVALLKMEEMGAASVEAAIRSVQGTCRSMGVELQD